MKKLNQINNNNNKIIVFNQLNKIKDISNIFISKKNVNKIFTKKSYQIRFGSYYISIPKNFCFLDKNKKNYLIGIKPYFIYNVYNAQKNWKEKIIGKKLIKKYNLINFHYLTVEKQRFENQQKRNPFFLQFKNIKESMDWHKKNTKKEFEEIKNLYKKNNIKNKKYKIKNKNNYYKKI